MQVFRNFLIGYKHAFWKIKLHNARHILYPALETVLEMSFEWYYSSISSCWSASWFHPPCQYRRRQVANLLCCTWDLFIFCILSLHPPSSSSWRCIYSYLFMPNLTSRTWCNVTYVSLKMSKLCYSFTLFCSYHLIKKCLIKISL